MQLIANKAQLVIGSRIAVLGDESYVGRWNQFGIIAKIEDERIHFVDPDTLTVQSSFLSDMGIKVCEKRGSVDPRYQTFSVNEREMTRLQDEYKLLAKQRAEANLLAAQAQADIVRSITGNTPTSRTKLLSKAARLALAL